MFLISRFNFVVFLAPDNGSRSLRSFLCVPPWFLIDPLFAHLFG